MAVSESSQTGKQPPQVGSYRLLKPLGTGGMSSVFHAVHVETGHEVAVKILPRTLAKNPTLLQRFLGEAKNAEALEHPNIAAIYDRGFDQGRHYLVLEYVEGGDLHERVRSSGPLPLMDAVKAIRAVAEGLLYASSTGVIHRDVKPANLLLDPQGHIKIIDLGLALQTENEDERVTRDGTTVGTVDYMSPEQARDSRATSERSDIYSLGCTFYFLIAGKPPYPGGDVPDKLGRHCTAPIPDVRELRPDASEPLARLIQKMMAKKPNGRFPTYAALIEAIDKLPETQLPSGSESFDALIVDEDDDEPSDDAIVLELASPEPKAPPAIPRQKPGRRIELAAHEVSLAELDADDNPAPRSRVKRVEGSPAPVPAREGFVEEQSLHTSFRPSGREIPLSTWIAAGAVVGLAIALLGFGVLKVLSPADSDSVVVEDAPQSRDAGQGEGDIANEAAPQIKTIPKRVDPIASSLSKAKSKSVTTQPATWVEPTDPAVEIVAEPSYPASVEVTSLPAWAKAAIPTTIEGPVVTLTRVVDSADESGVSSFRQALDKGGGLVEIADNGPFFEDDCRVVGKSRLIRSKPGHRPILMIRVNASTLAVVRDRSAVFTLDGSKLVLDGIDIVVDVRELPASQTSLFLLKGAELTLNRCSVTILNPASRPFSLVRVDDSPDALTNRSSQVRLEQTLVRIASPTAIDLNGPAEIAVVRSVIFSAGESVISQRASTARGDRRVYFYRSVVATRGSAVELPGTRGPLSSVRALGTTFAKVAGVDDAGLVRFRGDIIGSVATYLDWSGHDNSYVGWSAWSTASPRNTPVVTGLAATQAGWPGSDRDSHESKRGWPATVLEDDANLETIKGWADNRASTLTRIVSPSPSLLDATVRSFRIQSLPTMSGRSSNNGILSATVAQSNDRLAGVPFQAGVNASRPNMQSKGAPGVAKSIVPSATSAPSISAASDLKNGELTFSVDDPAWRGDLGLFLARKISPGSPKVRVKVVGGGEWSMSPVRLPDGASVEIESVSSSGQEPSWTVAQGSSAPALIELVKGELILKGIHLSWSASAKVPHLIRVEDGQLSIFHSLLRTGDGTMPAGSSLVLLRSPGTCPLSMASVASAISNNRPFIVIADSFLASSGGEAIRAELGRGVVSVVNSAILSEAEGSAIGLYPQKVARSRFETDLVLDHCSIAGERSLVQIGDWPGSGPGPDRPWLVSTKNSAFIEIPQRVRRESVLLRARGDGLSHGALFWQANGDGYDLSHFTTPGDNLLSSNRRRPDVKSQWIDFWGANHIVNVVGPSARRTDPGLTLTARDRLRPGTVTLDGLKLDAKTHSDLGAVLGSLPRRPIRVGSQTRF